MSLILHYLRPKDLFYDVGANIGLYTLLSSGVTQAQSVCFEPSSQDFLTLKNNIEKNNLSTKTIMINKGVGEKEDQVHFSIGHDTTNHILPENKIENSIKIDIVTLDNIIEKHGFPEVLKIDVEGYEYAVIKGATKLLGSNYGPNIIIIELRGLGNKYGFDEIKIHQYITNMGYKNVHYNPLTRKISVDKKFSAKKILGDMIYIKNIDKAISRLKSGSKFKIRNLQF